MFTSQLFFFIIFMAVFEAGLAEGPLVPLWRSFLADAGFIACLCLGLRILARCRFQAGISSFPVLIFRTQLISLLGLLVICAYFNLKSQLNAWAFMASLEILSSFAAAALFLLHMGVVWWALSPWELNPPGVRARLSFVAPLVFPWFMAAMIRDVFNLFWAGSRRFWESEAGWIVFLFIFFLLMLIVLPPVMKLWWRCPPLSGPALLPLRQILAASGVKINKICLWPVLNSRALTAAVLGFIPGLRYLLITPALLKHLSPSQLAAVAAHEAGHLHYRHMLIYALLLAGYLLLAYALSEPINALINLGLYGLAATRLGAGFLLTYGSWEILWRILLSLPMLALLLFYLRFVLGFFMRQTERQADFFALDLMRGPESMIGALERIAGLSGAGSRSAPSWHHFSIAQRVEAMRQAVPGRAAAGQGRFLGRCLALLAAVILSVTLLGYVLAGMDLSGGLRQQALQRLEITGKEMGLLPVNLPVNAD
ncbi:MAG: M48 family metalloprotease [Desulfarculales bacterium]|nr:M48 family metalloprotease [Desulfarculales bacterium]